MGGSIVLIGVFSLFIFVLVELAVRDTVDTTFPRESSSANKSEEKKSSWPGIQQPGLRIGSPIGLCPIQDLQERQATTKSLRRYDINDLGYPKMFHGWADVQGNGMSKLMFAMRTVHGGPSQGGNSTLRLACALGGTHGQSELAYESAWNFSIGHSETWYMKDEDGDGRDDYCRCLDDPTKSQVVCTKAGEKGFYGSKLQGGFTKTFTPSGPLDCKSRIVYREFGRVYGFV